ncbi:MAG: RNA polymerase sigma factor (sigma-70 family) [Sphingobacteriales bacterium]|jgi:RNA polymerase sigma factor (sigma-70 family)
MSKPFKIPDEELIRGCINNESHSQQMLFEKYSGKMFAVCRRYARDEGEANDMFQEGFIKVFKYLERFQEKSKLSTWMHSIFVNTSLKYLRKQKSWLEFKDEEDLDVITEEDNHFDEPKTPFSESELLEMIDSLPNGYKAVFNLYAIDGFTHLEIAEYLEISVNTSKSQLFRARKYLQKLVNDKLKNKNEK